MYKFQSLLGFLMRCDNSGYVVPAQQTIVSIPVGFSDALRHTCVPHLQLWHSKVSIPVGFSDALRREGHGRDTILRNVSIPVGFSDALRLDAP